MPSELELTLISHQAYAVSDENHLGDTIENWSLVASSSSTVSGFAAVAYTKGTELVIAFRGTDDTLDWANANVPASTGYNSKQVEDAIQYAADVMATHGGPNVTVTFTGHSLGGGLASLMAVFFDKEAKVFDPAPFRRTAGAVVMQREESALAA